MSGKVLTTVPATVCVLLFAVGLSAHHGTALYDVSEMIDVTGTVKDFKFLNPHVLISFDVAGADGTVITWSAELTTANRLSEADGWHRDTLKPGDEISITGSPARDGAPALWVEQIFMDGEPLLVITGGVG